MLETTDPLNSAASRPFGIPYLFPYQRLVVSNILKSLCFQLPAFPMA